jgi:transcriptional regulator with XRE-family HTH domain
VFSTLGNVVEPRYTPNQLIALNFARARKERGWTQEELAEILEPYLGTLWSVATISAIERSVDGARIKQFTADELFAIARAFSLPIGWFFSPPPNEPLVSYQPPGDLPALGFGILVGALLGNETGRIKMEKNLLAWAASQYQPWESERVISSIAHDRDMRTRQRLYAEFGDIEEVKKTLYRLGHALESISAISMPPFHRDEPDPEQVMAEWHAAREEAEEAAER